MVLHSFINEIILKLRLNLVFVAIVSFFAFPCDLEKTKVLESHRRMILISFLNHKIRKKRTEERVRLDFIAIRLQFPCMCEISQFIIKVYAQDKYISGAF